MEEWNKNRGYRHLLSSVSSVRKLEAYVMDPMKIAVHAFVPLIFNRIIQRRYKKNEGKLEAGMSRSHSKKVGKGIRKSNAKARPIHYACHLDAAIFAYYSSVLLHRYEELLTVNSKLNNSIVAYRKIPIDGTTSNKGSIHFAKEVFSSVKELSNQHGGVAVLAFDVENFFNGLNYEIIKKMWSRVMGTKFLEDDHYAVFRACTRVRFVHLSSIKKIDNKFSRGFNEKRLAKLRNVNGNNSFFGNMDNLREAIESKQIKVYSNPFKGKGIPQGLPISSVISNFYMLDFDTKVLDYLGTLKFGYYKRYSDDIIIVCPIANIKEAEAEIVRLIGDVKLEINRDKTERFIFSKDAGGVIRCREVKADGEQVVGKSLKYLGFEFDGGHVLIKSANLAKFYRKGISVIKSKSNQAIKAGQKNNCLPVLFRRRLFSRFIEMPRRGRVLIRRHRYFVELSPNNYRYKSEPFEFTIKSNYISYVKRAAEIMEEPRIIGQIRNHKKIFHQAVKKHFVDKKNSSL